MQKLGKNEINILSRLAAYQSDLRQAREERATFKDQAASSAQAMEVVAGAVAELHREAVRLQQELLRRADQRSLPGEGAALLADL